MKRMLLTALGIFTFCLMVNLESNEVSIEKTALAEGTCCPEKGSICGLGSNGWFEDYYYKSSGSCKSDDPKVDK